MIGELKEKLKNLTLRELKIRNNALNEIETMMHDIDQALNSDYGQSMQKMLADIKQGLFENLAHIKSGKSLFELPMPIENIELSEANMVTYEYTELPRMDDYPIKTEEVASALPEFGKSSEKKSKPKQDQRTSTLKKPKGVWQRFVYWLNSPWEVKWKDTDK